MSDAEARRPILDKPPLDAGLNEVTAQRERRNFVGVVAAFLVMLVLLFGLALPPKADDFKPPPPAEGFSGDLRRRCTESFIEQPLDHFGASKDTYRQRYFVCSEFWATRGPIFLYTGGDADVTRFLNYTGAMWESAPAVGALLVFAEHRFFGASAATHLKFLSSEQALADYAVLLVAVQTSVKAQDSTVVAFGAGYAGLLATWLRLKYPHLVVGAIASSAPVLAFGPTADPEAFARTVTYDASPVAGAHPNCIPNVRAAWAKITAAAATATGRAMLTDAFGLCPGVITTATDARKVMDWVHAAFDALAVGNYPYPFSYFVRGAGALPAHPVRAACAHLARDYFAESDPIAHLRAVGASVGVYYNSSGSAVCHAIGPPRDTDLWDYLWCSELYMPRASDGTIDMFVPAPHNETTDRRRCQQRWRVELRPMWATTMYGGRAALVAATNIVLTNGDLDPWAEAGLLRSVSESVVAIVIAGAAHHQDFMFSHPLDSDAVADARAQQRDHLRRWVAAHSPDSTRAV
ncbi:lysosomal Pro-X carboxypeptidase [Achlya hypogyna]|uniref:Lysosomal Pro-X carboxypeptidase n=1 Tax=Achlya hypogyna TaxID=1202772 RepID=A0A1V9ZN72_ACHHY|nr:lysosomal Pro-X carboxypeptidase [Achlya hypogyna]